MVQGQPQGRETEVWWHQVKVWSAAVVSLLLLSACFIVSCLVNHDNFVYTKIGRKLHKLQDHQQYLSHLTCFKERKGLKDWHCCPTSWSPFQSSCYFISTELKNWTDSEKNCSEMGAHLMMINTKEEQVLSYRERSLVASGEGLVCCCGFPLTPQCLFHRELFGYQPSGNFRKIKISVIF
ncbi:C-type lectin domain family 4 member C isoform X3 [Trichechus manatus latirostris]|uniref:C-type lectin domain family 4 member C isoform X3 n=1 Tax=Trichechus manatus latirostris TaxID=127582 RepID=A0A2Y9RYW4_TRIMA|nr:C-type lectin domain family 4 member C isoform X3 [Trichechus manatus latirostris]